MNWCELVCSMCQLHAPDEDALEEGILHAVPDTVQYMMSLTSSKQIQMEVRQLKGIHLARTVRILLK